MTLSLIAAIADLLTALAVVVSLLFVAYEMHASNRQAKRANMQSMLDGIRNLKHWGRDVATSEIIVRGRLSFHDLSPTEKFVFANFMEECIAAYDSFLLVNDSNLLQEGEAERAGRGAFRQFLAHPGAREWWRQSGMETRWPTHLVGAIEDAIAEVEAKANRSKET